MSGKQPAAAPPARFEMTWVTTPDHMSTLAAVYRAAPLWRKIVGRYPLPAGFPHVRGVFAPWSRMPLVMIAEGVAEIDGAELRFTAGRKRVLLWRVRDVRHDLNLTIRRDDVTSIDEWPWQSPVLRYYSLPFTRIRTSRNDDLLFCVGTSGPAMGAVRERSRQLHAALTAWAA